MNQPLRTPPILWGVWSEQNDDPPEWLYAGRPDSRTPNRSNQCLVCKPAHDPLASRTLAMGDKPSNPWLSADRRCSVRAETNKPLKIDCDLQIIDQFR
jgi:hypothetical protein